MSKELDALRSQISTLEQLLQVHERVALEQSQRLEKVIAERDAAFAEVEAERSRLLDLLEKIPAAVSMYEGPDMVLRYMNPRAEEIVGERARETGRPMAELFPEAEQQGYLALFREVFDSGEPFLGIEAPFELERDGVLLPLSFDFALLPIKQADGTLQGVLSFAYEVTEKVKNRQEIESLAGRLKNLAEASLQINAAEKVDEVLRVVATWARELVGANEAVISVGAGSEATDHGSVALTEKGDPKHMTALRGPDPYGLDAVVSDEKAAVHLNSEQILNVPGRKANSSVPVVGEWIGAPLISHEGDHMGSIQLTDPVEGTFDIHAAAIMTQLSQIASTAIENVRTYQREHRIAETLQRSLLPQSLPRMANFVLRSSYVAGADGVSVGGDWYDAIALGDGKVGVVLGDVVGKGIRAAVLMSQFRNALRVYAFETGSPAQVVERLDRLMAKVDASYMATLIYGVVDDAARTFTFTNAGHLSPALKSGAGVRFLEEARSVPIGVVPSTIREEATVTLEQGSSLVFYTDGLVERRGEPLDHGLSRLIEALRGAGDASSLADHLVAELLDGKTQEDDIAILTVSAI